MNFLPFLIARRLYLKQNKNYTVLLTSILSKIGISISIFSLIISFSALNGFQALLKKTISSTLPHGIIQLTDESLLKWQDVIKELKIFPGIDYSEPYIITNGLLVIKNKVKPIEIKSFSNINYLKKNFSISYNNDFFKKKHYNHGIILSSSLSKDLSIKKGDWINVLFLKNKDNNPSYSIQKFSLKIIDIFQANGILDSNIGYVPFGFFKKFFHIENHINTIELHISDPFDADKIILNIAKKINIPFLAYTWTNSYKYIYHNIKKIKVIVYLSISLLVIISCFSIASISLMTISKKTQEIAILRSIGANNILIQLIFLYYGLRTIIVGNLIGLFLGIITILNSKRIMLFLEKKFQDNMLLDNFYYHCFFLLKINLSDVIIIFISTTIIGIITNWYPVRYASKINPSKILREY